MKVLLLFSFLILPFLLFSQQNNVPKVLPITKAAFVTMMLPGSPDFLTTDGDDVWILNIDRVEKLSVKSKKPVLTVPIPGACGALIVGFNSLWVASCSEQAIYRVDKKNGHVLSIIHCSISDRNGEIMLAIGDG